MKKLLAITLVSVSLLGLASGRAVAWPLRHCWRCNKCCGCNIHCTQYNAFSPWCCDFPAPAHGWGPGNSGYYPPLSAYYGDNGYANHLPAGPQAGTSPAYAGPVVAPGYNSVPAYSSTVPAPSSSVQGIPPGYSPMPSYPTGSANPNGVPTNYPGAMGYGPGYGGPAYYPGAMGYGPGYGAPTYNPGAMGYGPAYGVSR
jgi:hypothetical protein